MKRSESTIRAVRRQQQSETKGFLLVLLLIVAAVALVQVLLFLTIKRSGAGGTGFPLPQVGWDLRGMQSRSGGT
jgi:hypothetical protein